MSRSTTNGLDERGVCGDAALNPTELPKTQEGELIEGTYALSQPLLVPPVSHRPLGRIRSHQLFREGAD